MSMNLLSRLGLRRSTLLALIAATPLWGTALLSGCVNEQRNKSIEAMNKGVEAGRQKLYDTATRNLKLATDLDPTNTLAWANQGAVYKDMRKWEECAKAFAEASKLEPSRKAETAS